jgi:beta-phosphoglucomutase-like phosphatase (HAD superfamily)
MINLSKEKEKEKTNKFFLFDLDGTLVDTDAIHVECYRLAGAPPENLAYKLRHGELQVPLEMKQLKAKLVEDMCKPDGSLWKGIQWMPGAEELLTFCSDHTINYCIVTNTPRKPVEAICANFPLLHNANQQGRLLCREDYTRAKPTPDGYQTAIDRFYKGEKYIFGFENTYIGWCALQSLGLPNQQNYLVLSGGQEDEEDVRKRGGLCIPSLKIIS